MARVKLKITNVTNEKVRVGRSWKSDDPYLEPNEVLERNIKPDTIGESSVKHLDHLMKKGDVNIDIKPENSGISDLQELLSVSSRLSGDGSAEVWVSPDGNDSNPGTRNAPLASIQEGIDQLVERVGHENPKKVTLKSGFYREHIHVNTRNILVEGALQHREASDKPRIRLDEQRTVVSVNNYTREAYKEFLEEGGLDYSWDGENFSYEGAQITEREVEFSADDYNANVTFRNIRIVQDSDVKDPAFSSIGVPEPGKTSVGNIGFRGVVFEKCVILSTSGTSSYFKNCDSPTFDGTSLQYNSTVVFDETDYVTVYEGGDGYSSTESLVDVIYSYGQSDHGFEGGTNNPDSRVSRNGIIPPDGGDLFIIGDYALSADFAKKVQAKIVTSGDVKLSHTVDDGFTHDRIICELLHFNSSAQLVVGFLGVNSLSVDGGLESNLEVGTIKCGGSIDVGNSSTLQVDGGNIQGDLNIGGIDTLVNLEQVTIHGNLTVTNEATIDFTGVYVKGDIILQDAGDVTWKGGSFYGTLTDPDNKLGSATSGEYLNV